MLDRFEILSEIFPIGKKKSKGLNVVQRMNPNNCRNSGKN